MITTNGVDYYSMEEASKKMGVSYPFLQKLRKRGEIGSIMDGRKIWISSKHIEEYFKGHEIVVKVKYESVEKTGGKDDIFRESEQTD